MADRTSRSLESIRPRVTYANVMATLAVFVALGGGAYAATSGGGFTSSSGVITGCVPRKGGTLKVVKLGKKCPKGTVALAFNHSGVPGATGIPGQTGSAGPAGATGATGATGASDAYSATKTTPETTVNSVSVTVPAGNYIGWGGCTVQAFGPVGSTSSTTPTWGAAAATLTSNNDTAHSSSAETAVEDIGGGEVTVATPHPGGPLTREMNDATMANNTVFALPQGGTITEVCLDAPTSDVTGMSYGPVSVTAVPVNALPISSP